MRYPSWANIAAVMIFVLNATVSAQESDGRALTIRLYNTAAPPAVLHAAAARSGRIFKAAGVELTWQTAPNNASEAHSLDFSSAQGSSSDSRDYIAVRLIAGLPETTKPGALGFALPQARFGAHVTILYDRVARTFAKLGDDEAAVLGHVIAHEIAHVLLSSQEHSATGLMKARWSNADIALAATGCLYFSRKESARMREAVQRRQELRGQPDHSSVVTARSAPRPALP